jgi:hypothetical protein
MNINIPIANPAEPVLTAEQLNCRIEEFQAAQQAWERQRWAEQEQLESQARLLADAWMRLETEQITTATTPAIRHAGSRGSVSDEPRPNLSAAEPETRAPRGEAKSIMPQPPSVNRHPGRAANLTAALRQFEKLRNEIKSARR